MGLSMLNLSSRKDVEGFIRFNSMIFPSRRDVKERFFWQYVDNPALRDKKHPYVLLFHEKGTLVGQSLLNPCDWRYNGKAYRDYFGCDYFVLPEHRGAGGAALAMKTIRDRRDYFAIGVSEVAQKIWKRLGVRIVGKVRLYIWFSSKWVPMILLFSALAGRGKGKAAVKGGPPFPESVRAEGREFRLLTRIGHWHDVPWKDTLQFSRSTGFLRWRFFDSPFEYGLYSTTGKSPAYFVVRRFSSKGVDMLLLVDYRVPFRDAGSWKSVLEASKALARRLGCGGVIAGSSHSFFDAGLQERSFRDLRSGSVIMTNTTKAGLDGALDRRDAIFATMADSDPDLNFEDPLGMAIGKVKGRIRGLFGWR
ncbi:MAG: GNAT family N-acetyltransferase [Candidatus Aenigmarchaeota archaeon]|nr:GNAT family N-acetyltransferase [Candidatus Aenigmarchaeota archaeon]